MAKQFIQWGSIFAFLGIALGAFGAHILKEKLSENMMAAYQTGILYHLIHAVALVLVGVISQWLKTNTWVQWSGWLFIAGILLFSGSLYVMSLTGIRGLGAVTPFGGLAFLAGWIMLAISASSIN